MSLLRSASFILAAGVLSVACGARSGLDCLGETCGRLDENDADGFAPTDPADPVSIPPRDGAGSGGRPGRPRPTDDNPFPEQIPSETPIDMPNVMLLCPTGGTFRGSIDITSWANLEALRGCTEIDGDVAIFGMELGRLEQLSSLQSITGLLRLSFAGSLEGLEALQRVGTLIVENSGTTTLAPLRSLRQIGGARAQPGALIINQNPNLVDLGGLSLDVLGSISITGNPSLRTLLGLNVPTDLENVSIVDNPALADVDGLASLQRATSIQIEDSPSLGQLQGLVNVQSLDSLTLVNDAGLSRLDLPIREVSVLYVDNVGVTSLSGLIGLARLESAIIQNNPNLVDVDQLGQLVTLAELSVINNPSLLRLPEFLGVVLDQLHVRNNASLQVGPSYPLVAEAGTVFIAENPALTGLTGLRLMQRARSIDISRNPSLVELDLGTLGSARNVRITCNVALPESSLDNLVATVQGTVDVWGNQGSPTPCP